MKKILALIICAVIFCASTVAVLAEGEAPDAVTPNDVVEENVPPTEEEAVGSENSGEEVVPEVPEETPEEVPEDLPEETPEETPTEPAPEETDFTPIPDSSAAAEKTIPEKVVEYIQAHLEEISVIVTLILTIFYQVRKHKVLNKSIATLNNNAVTVADNSNQAMQQALSEVGGMSSVVGGYKDEMSAMLAEIRKNTEEKRALELTLEEVHNHLEQSKLANIEFANELAELLVLANIPNSKKDELYARHRAAVDAIAAKENATATEVNTDGIGQTE